MLSRLSVHLALSARRLMSMFPTSSRSPSPRSDTAALPLTIRTSGRQHLQRHIPADMVRSDQLPSDEEESDSSSSSSSGYYKSPPPAPKPKQEWAPVPSRKPNGGSGRVVSTVPINPDKFFRYSGPPWPTGNRELFCHQCRTKSHKLIMACECSRNYCVRCIMLRYEPGTVAFELNPPEGTCPSCTGTCRCDKCTTTRGEVYVSHKRSGPASAPRPRGNSLLGVPARSTPRWRGP
ncbi:hypothetical protein B0H10DRAFT_785932 [Mycena sp. CBHHK59/15]|nr:hypothetical protein B0H10DRAFT_785932 [Mycena sp. CBHHK59/15]